MRKIALLFVMAALVMACKSSNSMTAKPKETNVADKAIKGEWTLQSITYSEQGKFLTTTAGTILSMQVVALQDKETSFS